MPASLRAVFRRLTLDAGANSASPARACSQLLLLWLALRTLIWIVIVIGNQPNAPLDVIEMVGWGNAWQAGYPKHPPLPNWVAAAAARLSPGDVWGVYIASYLASACCVWSAWQVGKAYLSPRLALFAALSVDGLLALTNDVAEWNNNVALNLGWALTAWFGFKAIRTEKLQWWLACGIGAGIGLLTKYTMVFHLAPIAAYLLLSPRGRRSLRGPGPYAAAAITLMMFIPHVIWVVTHDFTTLRFAASRTAGTHTWYSHLTNPVIFLLHQVAFIAPVIFILVPLLKRQPLVAPEHKSADPWLLRAAVIGPVALFTLYGVITGCQLRDIWGATFWTYLGAWLLAEFGGTQDHSATSRAFRRWALVVAILWGFFIVKQRCEPYLDPKPTRGHYPGRQLADEVNRRWNERYSHPFGVAAGEAWSAGNIACYSAHRPTMFTDWSVDYLMFDPARSPWTGDEDMRRRGGVIVWLADQLGDDIPLVIRIRFPDAVAQPPIVLPYQTGAHVPPLRIGVAFVPPEM